MSSSSMDVESGSAELKRLPPTSWSGTVDRSGLATRSYSTPWVRLVGDHSWVPLSVGLWDPLGCAGLVAADGAAFV